MANLVLSAGIVELIIAILWGMSFFSRRRKRTQRLRQIGGSLGKAVHDFLEKSNPEYRETISIRTYFETLWNLRSGGFRWKERVFDRIVLEITLKGDADKFHSVKHLIESKITTFLDGEEIKDFLVRFEIKQEGEKTYG